MAGRHRFGTLEGFTAGALVAGVVSAALWAGIEWSVGDRFGRTADDRAASAPEPAADPSTTLTSPATTERATSTSTTIPQRTTTTVPTTTTAAPTTTVATTAPPLTVATEVTVAVPAIAPGICDREIEFAGEGLPVVDQSWLTIPLGDPTTVSFSKKAVGHPSDDEPNDIYVLDGACQVEHLFTVARGESRSADLQAGQLLIVASSDAVGWFPADGSTVDLG